MEVHLVDGTYELFRHFYSPAGTHLNAAGEPVGAARGVLRSLASMLADGCTHIAVATDQVITSFRNDLYPAYKDGTGIDPDLWSQFPLLEEAVEAAGFTLWAMVDHEADDALASAAARAAADPSVTRAVICTPDKDLAQCVTDPRVVQFDRRAGDIRDEAAVIAKYGVPPASIPDWLALVGDSADGFPGLPGWGAKSAAAVLTRYPHLEDIPRAPGQWDVAVRGAAKLCATFDECVEEAILFRTLATLVDDLDVGEPSQWRWTGPTPAFAELAERIDGTDLIRSLERLRPT